MKRKDIKLSDGKPEIIHYMGEDIIKMDVLRKVFASGSSGAISLPKAMRGKFVRVIYEEIK